MGIVWTIVIGFVVGLVARAIKPGKRGGKPGQAGAA